MKLMLSALLMMVLNTAHAAEDVKIGIVDMQRAIQDTSAGKKAKESLEAEYNKRKKDLEKKEGDLKKMNEDLEKKSLVLSDEVKAKKQQELQEEMLKYRELVGKNQAEIQKKEKELLDPILKRLKDVISDIASKENFTVILEKSNQGVLFAKKEFDVTDKVIKAFEKK